MSTGNRIGYSQNPRTLKCFRCHFLVPTSGGQNEARSFVLDFGEGETTEINEELRMKNEECNATLRSLVEESATAQDSSAQDNAPNDSSFFILHSSLDKWISSGAYREHNLSLGIVARQMGVPQKQLQMWLRQSEYKKLAGLVASLRIKEAQRVLVEHRDWSVESVADYCGFNDRKYFHLVFQQLTGTTPAKYQQAHS